MQQSDTFITLPREVCASDAIDWPGKVLWA